MKPILITIGLAFAVALPFSNACAQSTNVPSSKLPSPAVRKVAVNPSAYAGNWR